MLWHTDEERRAKSVEGGAGSIDRRLTTTERGLDGEYPASRCLADRWCHHGAQQSAPPGSTAQTFSHGPRTVGPPKPIWASRGTGALIRSWRAPPPRRGCTSTAAAEPAHCRDLAAPRRRIPSSPRATAARLGHHHRTRELVYARALRGIGVRRGIFFLFLIVCEQSLELEIF
jgi:hypothetical protein